MKALIVDDAVFMRKLISSLINRFGFEVIEAEDGEEAVFKAKAEQPGLIIMDIIMPKMDGITAIKQIKQEMDVKVVVCSSLYDKKLISEALKAGADDYITKPISRELFLETIGGIIK